MAKLLQIKCSFLNIICNYRFCLRQTKHMATRTEPTPQKANTMTVIISKLLQNEVILEGPRGN